MDFPIEEEPIFQPGDINICIFPHLREFLVVDARATVPDSPHTYVMTTEEVLDARFYGEVEDSVGQMVREMPSTFFDLSALPQRVDEAIRELALRAILRRMDSENILEFAEPPEVSVFLCVGPALGMSSMQVNQTVRSMMQDRAEELLVEHCISEMSRLLDEERQQVKAEESDLSHLAVAGDPEHYFTIWSMRDTAGPSR